jgi:CxxC motif-containing protein
MSSEDIDETAHKKISQRMDICLRCPRGCEIHTILGADGEILDIDGNKCKLGPEYVKQEIQDPRRVLPTSVKVKNGVKPLAPVWTPEPIPKAMLLELAEASREVELEAPVHIGDFALENWNGTGIDLLVSGEVPRAEEAG